MFSHTPWCKYKAISTLQTIANVTYSYLHLAVVQPNVTPRSKMLNAIKLIASAVQFQDVTPNDFIKTPEKPTRRVRAIQTVAKDICEIDDTFAPIVEDELVG